MNQEETNQPDSSSDSESESCFNFDLFQEPDSFRPKSASPTNIDFNRLNGDLLNIRLVSKHPLWGHVLYPASKVLSNYIEKNSFELFNPDGFKNVLELGAGAGLPGLSCVLSGAKLVVTTDFPDPDLLENLKWNADNNLPQEIRNRMVIEGLKWGSNTDEILKHINSSSNQNIPEPVQKKFDIILLSDLVFNHNQHESLLKTCETCLTPSSPSSPSNLSSSSTSSDFKGKPCCLVFFSHHLPQRLSKDLEFFNLAKTKGWKCCKILEDSTFGVAFPNDLGDQNIRKFVHGWILTR